MIDILGFGQVTEESLLDTKLIDIVKNSLNKDPVTQDDVKRYLQFEFLSTLTELNISASETRQVRQFEPNNYFISGKLDIALIQDLIREMVKSAAPDKKVSLFLEYKIALVEFIMRKHNSTENFWRKLISISKQEDGLQT